MNQHISQEEVRRIIISDLVKKRNSIVPVIGEDTIVYHDTIKLVKKLGFDIVKRNK